MTPVMPHSALSDAGFCNQHNAETHFALHHASVSIGSLFERSMSSLSTSSPSPSGEGIPLIEARHRSVPLTVLSSQSYRDGVVRLHYSV